MSTPRARVVDEVTDLVQIIKKVAPEVEDKDAIESSFRILSMEKARDQEDQRMMRIQEGIERIGTMLPTLIDALLARRDKQEVVPHSRGWPAGSKVSPCNVCGLEIPYFEDVPHRLICPRCGALFEVTV